MLIRRMIRMRVYGVVVLACAFSAALVWGPAGTSAATPGVTNGLLAFTSTRGGTAALWTINADGSGQTRLAQTPGDTWDGAAAYSPDGRQIAYECSNMDICVMNSDGSDPALVTSNPWPSEWVSDYAPTWSPDGSQIAFDRLRDGHDDLFVIGANGTGLRQLTTDSHDENAVWSPDGTKIAFDGFDSKTKNQQVFVVNADGTGRQQLTNTPNAWNSEPAWSPDGSSIAYQRVADGFFAPGHLHVMNADGSGDRAITTGSSDDGNPKWSPDGSLIAFDRDAGESMDVWVISPTGSGARQVTSKAELNVLPSWQPVPANAPTSPTPATSGIAPAAPAPEARLEGISQLEEWLFNTDLSTTRSPAGALTLGPRLELDASEVRRETLAIEPTTQRGRAFREKLLTADSWAAKAGKDFSEEIVAAAAHDPKQVDKYAKAAAHAISRFLDANQAVYNAS
jgi:TolB protein